MFFPRRRQLSRAQISARCQRVTRNSLRGFRQPQLPLGIFGIELRDALQAKKRVFLPRLVAEKFRGLGVLLDGLGGVILPLLQKSVSCDALWRLLDRAAAQKTVVNRQRFVFVARI